MRRLVSEREYAASFYFRLQKDAKSAFLVTSKPSTRIVAVNCCGIILTTLNICRDYDALIVFLREIGLKTSAPRIPVWLESYPFYSDEQLKRGMSEKRQRIKDLDDEIKNSEAAIASNARYKSILISSGNDLVLVVFDILQEILSCDLSGFSDKKKEVLPGFPCDFLHRIA